MERRLICQMFRNCVLNKCTTCLSQHLNILCLIHANLPHPENHAKLAVTHEFKLIFIQHTVNYQQPLTHMLSLNEIRHRQLPSFCIDKRHWSFLAADRSLESMCSGSAEPSIRLAHILAGQLLKFCDHAICCNASTLNNSQNLHLDFLEASI